MNRSRRHRLTPPALPSVALAALALALAAPIACGEAGDGAPIDVGTGGSTAAGAGGSTNGMGAAGAAGGVVPPDPFASGAELRVPVTAGQRAFVRLEPLALVTPAEPATTDWDVAFENYDVYTNGGVSGPGQASAFGPFSVEEFATSPMPMPPFTITDEAGGAFRRWYYYEGAPYHVLWSRHHVFGIKDGASHWKVQVASYYTQREGAPIPALYTLRYASISPEGAGAPQRVVVDGSGLGTEPGQEPKTECLDLGTGAKTALTATEASASNAWHLCFRRQSITVNGELGGPRGVTAVDFDAATTETETLAQLKALDDDEAAQLAHFDSITFERFASSTLRGDRTISAFGEGWVDTTTTPPRPADASWLVKGADGVTTYMVGFAGFDGASATGPGTIVLRAKKFGP
jgi:hypothetical protein